MFGMVTFPPFPVYFISTPLEINKPEASMTASNTAGASVSVPSSHWIFSASDAKAVILPALLIVMVIVIEAEEGSNFTVPPVMDVTFPLDVFLPPSLG